VARRSGGSTSRVPPPCPGLPGLPGSLRALCLSTPGDDARAGSTRGPLTAARACRPDAGGVRGQVWPALHGHVGRQPGGRERGPAGPRLLHRQGRRPLLRHRQPEDRLLRGARPRTSRPRPRAPYCRCAAPCPSLALPAHGQPDLHALALVVKTELQRAPCPQLAAQHAGRMPCCIGAGGAGLMGRACKAPLGHMCRHTGKYRDLPHRQTAGTEMRPDDPHACEVGARAGRSHGAASAGGRARQHLQRVHGARRRAAARRGRQPGRAGHDAHERAGRHPGRQPAARRGRAPSRRHHRVPGPGRRQRHAAAQHALHARPGAPHPTGNLPCCARHAAAQHALHARLCAPRGATAARAACGLGPACTACEVAHFGSAHQFQPHLPQASCRPPARCNTRPGGRGRRWQAVARRALPHPRCSAWQKRLHMHGSGMLWLGVMRDARGRR